MYGHTYPMMHSKQTQTNEPLTLPMSFVSPDFKIKSHLVARLVFNLIHR